MPAFDPPLTVAELQTAFGSRFSAIEPLSAGAQGAVFKVKLGETAGALKIYAEGERTRGERECRALEKLDAANVVKLLEWGAETIRVTECIFVLTEFIDGETLKQRIDRQRLDEGQARRLGIDVASAILAMWSSCDRIVHRDINPKNIMLRNDESAVIIDLGIARYISLEALTTWGKWLGTLGYMSPEQARARKALTFKSDLFSLGIVLYEAMAQLHPFDHRQDRIGSTSPESLRRLTGASEDFSRIVHSLMASEPIDRPRSCGYLIERLRKT